VAEPVPVSRMGTKAPPSGAEDSVRNHGVRGTVDIVDD
jgi:hypothetical protein